MIHNQSTAFFRCFRIDYALREVIQEVRAGLEAPVHRRDYNSDGPSFYPAAAVNSCMDLKQA